MFMVLTNGKNLFSLETMGTESLSTVIIDMIMLRGTEADTENFTKISASSKFLRANTATKIKTLEKYFDIDTLFGEYKPDELPTANISSYSNIDYAYFNNLIKQKL